MLNIITSLHFHKKDNAGPQVPAVQYFIELENGAEGDLDNNQDDEITITSKGMSDKRKLFPTNNAFNYVITLNKYSSKYEKFDINHAGQDETQDPSSYAKATADKKARANKKKLKRKERNQ